MSLHEPKPDDHVESLYRDFLAANSGPERVDFEAFCRRHPTAAPALRRLHAERAAPETVVASPLGRHLGHDEAHRVPSHGKIGTGDARESRYRLEGEIARGGMGAILKVWDTDLHRALAMKVILGKEELRIDDGSTAEVRLSRFLEEAQITGQLDHPGVVPVHELGVDKGGRVYFTMRLVKGRDLAEIIAKARSGEDGWNLTRALNVLHRVCETMAYAHQKGVVHRDLKPENVMVGQFGETYAMDWGLARVIGKPDGEAQRRRLLANSAASFVHTDRHDHDAAADAGSRTQAGAILGTPCYMPPEQAAGELESIGPQSDVYAIGAILYHLLTGKRPYEQVQGGSLIAVVRAVLEGPPIPVQKLAAKVPPELVAICERAMARRPEDRYASMVEMAADLRAYLENRVVRAYQSGAVAEFVKWVRRNRAFSAAIASLVFVATAGLVAFAWTQGERATAIAAEQERTRIARDEALANLEQAHQQGYLANVTAASASLAAGETVEGKRHLANCVPELRGWEWHHLSLAADASVRVLETNGGGIGGLALDSTGGRLVTSSTDGSLRLWDLPQQHDAAVLAGADASPQRSAPAVAFLAGDRRVIAVGRQLDDRVLTFDSGSGEVLSRLTLPVRALYAIAVSPLGDRAAIGAADHSIHVVDLRTGDSLGRMLGHQGTLRALAFSRDGARLASGSEDRTARVWNVADRTTVGVPIEATAAVHAVAISPTDGQLALGLENGAVWRFRGPMTEAVDHLEGHRGAVYGLSFAGDGTQLCSASFDKTLRIWNTADGRLLAVLSGHEQPVHNVQFAGGAATLASGSADGSVRLWNIERNRATVTHRGPDESLAAVDISRDGACIAIASAWPGTIEVLDAATGARIRLVRGPEDSVVALAFAPDGKRLAVAYQEESSVRICDVDAGALSDPMLGHTASPTAMAWSPDGATIVSGAADRTVQRWDVAARQKRGEPMAHDHAVTALALSDDGGSIASGTLAGAIWIWDAATGTRTRKIEGEGQRVLALAFAPTGLTFAAGYSDGTVRVFARDAPTPSLTLAGHERSVTSLRFLPDGTRLVSGSFDGTVRVWDATSGRLALTLRDHQGPVTGIAAGGTRIASVSHDGTLRIRNSQRTVR